MRKIKRRSATDSSAGDVRRALKRRTPKVFSRVEFLSSGSTTLNCALSGKGLQGGWARGRVVNIVGDGSSGKTLLALELCFWCYNTIKKVVSKIFPRVKRVTIVYNNCEGVMDFPLEKMYGQKFCDAVKWMCSPNIEQMGRDYYRRISNLKKGEFLLYIVDSWDSLKSWKDIARFEEAVEKDIEEKGSYNLEKQKFSSAFFASLSGKLENNKFDSTLVIISQVRTKIGATFGKKQYRAGGKALDFYTHQVAWIREIEKLRKAKKKEKRVYGIVSEVKVERSKVAKPFRESNFRILYDYGLDDIGSMINYLHGNKNKIKFDGESFKTQTRLIKYIEENNLEEDIKTAVEGKWQDVEKAFEKDIRKRKKRF
jgi:recombination protein RecA